MKETDVAAFVVRWLRERGWDTYQEVEDIDIVSLHETGVGKDPTVAICEVKLAAGFDLIAQGIDRLDHANLVWIAAAKVSRGRGRHVLDSVCRHHGLGLLHVDPELAKHEAGSTYARPFDDRHGDRGPMTFCVRERVQPRRRVDPPCAAGLRSRLDPRQRDNPAGVPGGVPGVWRPPTEFGLTIGRVSAAVKAKPGMTVRELVDAIEHHYRSPASARNALRSWIMAGNVDDVALRDGKLFPR